MNNNNAKRQIARPVWKARGRKVCAPIVFFNSRFFSYLIK